MPEEQLKAFIAKVQADASLQEQLKAEDSDPVAIAKAAGFAITTEDIKTHRQILSEDDHRLLHNYWKPWLVGWAGLTGSNASLSQKDTL
ncbi:Nitrogen fixation protein of unknown function [Prochlorococcus sp. MIT 1303]|nr:Nitrogen fixation protein of unknown function [Prochlorococcus sp. MIT 1303]